MTPQVNTEDLIDSRDVAKLLGLTHLHSVSTYQHRYQDMPRPVIDLGPGRPRLWRRQEIEAWAHRRQPPAVPVSHGDEAGGSSGSGPPGGHRPEAVLDAHEPPPLPHTP
jgi:predicted DNA-binding transcriptional regulator AlpA